MRFRALVALFAALAVAALPATAAAHVHLTSTSPEDGAELDEAPEEVVLTFDGELDPDASSFTVTDAAGAEVGSGEVDLDVAERNELRGSVDISEPGVYTVSWTVVGTDGHEITGEFGFGFRSDEAEEGTVANTAMPRQEPIAPLTLAGIALVVAAGAAALRQVVRRP